MMKPTPARKNRRQLAVQPASSLPPLRDLPIWYDAPPVWLVNLPAFVAHLLASTCLAVAIALLSTRTHFWIVAVWLPLVPLTLAASTAAETVATHVVIDPLRLTLTTGISRRRVASLELYRIINADAVTIWWQRPLGFGTLILETSDAYRGRWVLPGIRNVEQVREVLTAQALELRAARGVREVNMGRL